MTVSCHVGSRWLPCCMVGKVRTPACFCGLQLLLLAGPAQAAARRKVVRVGSQD